MKLLGNARRRRCIDTAFSSITTLALTIVMLVAAVITCALWLLSGVLTLLARRLGWRDYYRSNTRITILKA